MKKFEIFVLFLFLLIFNFQSFAQTFEVNAGVNLSTMLSKDEIETVSEDYQMAPGLLLGATAEFPLIGLFSFESGLLFSQKGYKLDTHYPIPTDKGEYVPIYDNTTLNYIEIPLSLKTTTKFKNLPVLFTLGPYIGIGLNEKTTRSNYSGGITERKTYSHKMGNDSNWKKLDYGLQAGIGMEIKNMVLRVNYSYGLANISQVSFIKSKNRIIGFTLGYKIYTEKHNP